MLDEARWAALSRSGWPTPIPLDGRDRLPAFPVESLPGIFGEFASALAEQMQTGIDMPAVMVLGAFAAAAGGRAVIEPRDGWREPTNIYGVVAMNPAGRKSGVCEAVTKPLRAGERSLVADAHGEILKTTFEHALAAEAAHALMSKAARYEGADAHEKKAEAEEAARMAEAIVVPVEPRLLADDVSPEALVSLMAAQRGKIALLSAEGGPFDVMAGRYSKFPPLETYLKAHAGDTIRVDRKGRAAEYIEHPALTIVVACQPDVLRTIAQREGFRSRGLLARFLYSMPQSRVGHRQIGTPAVPRATHDGYDQALRDLVLVLAGWTDPAVIQFTPEANERLLELERAIEPRLAPGGALYSMRDWGGKMAGATVRISGLLHLAQDVEGWRKPLGLATFEDAVKIAAYFEAHTKAVFAFMGADEAIEHAHAILGWCRAHTVQHFTKRDAHRGLTARFPKSGDLDAPLALLEDRGWIQRRPDPPIGPEGGRPPSPTYDVHPDTTATTDRTQSRS